MKLVKQIFGRSSFLSVALLAACAGNATAPVSHAAVADKTNSGPGNGPVHPFSGLYKGSHMSLILWTDDSPSSPPGDHYLGSIIMGDTPYAVVADIEDGKVNGWCHDKAGHEFTFTAEKSGRTLVLKTGGKTYSLTLRDGC